MRSDFMAAKKPEGFGKFDALMRKLVKVKPAEVTSKARKPKKKG